MIASIPARSTFPRAFERGLHAAMTRRTGSSQTWLNRAYPHHVALPADEVKKLRKRILVACATLNTAPHTRTARRDGQTFVIYRFANKPDAQDFIDLFGGESLDLTMKRRTDAPRTFIRAKQSPG